MSGIKYGRVAMVEKVMAMCCLGLLQCPVSQLGITVHLTMQYYASQTREKRNVKCSLTEEKYY